MARPPKKEHPKSSSKKVPISKKEMTPQQMADIVPFMRIVEGRYAVYLPEYGDQIIKCAAEGMSLLEACSEIGISRNSVYTWAKQRPEFREKLIRASELCESWWERIGRYAALGRIEGFNSLAWALTMKNRFGWKDTRDTTVLPGTAETQPKFDVSVLSPEKRQQLQQILLEAKTTPEPEDE